MRLIFAPSTLSLRLIHTRLRLIFQSSPESGKISITIRKNGKTQKRKVDLAMVAHEHHAQGGTVGHGCHQDVRPERYGTDVPGAGA